MIAPIKTTGRPRALNSYAEWIRRNKPSLIKASDWKRMLQMRHPAVQKGDRKLLDFMLENYGYLLRPKRTDYPMIRDRLDYGLRLERKALKQLERMVKNDALFAAISSRALLWPAFAATLRREMQAALREKHHLVKLYEDAIEGLGRERGAKGNQALAFLIASMQTQVYRRTGKSLSQSTKDVDLVHALANAIAGGPDWQTVKNKIRGMKKHGHLHVPSLRDIGETHDACA